MRVGSVFLLALTCFAQSDPAQVESVLKQMERAEQTGDFNTWLSLWTRDKAAELEKMRPYARAHPEVHF